jgi:hypothetical protein
MTHNEQKNFLRVAVFLLIISAMQVVSIWNLSVATAEAPVVDEPVRDHRLETWLSALEYCESRGNGDAINPEDLDGTPSYYWYQFKPSTFSMFGIKYGLLSATATPESVLADEMRDYELTREIVRRMTQDERVDITRQFPWCVKKLGHPPRVSVE